jgi:hypothetical protein
VFSLFSFELKLYISYLVTSLVLLECRKCLPKTFANPSGSREASHASMYYYLFIYYTIYTRKRPRQTGTHNLGLEAKLRGGQMAMMTLCVVSSVAARRFLTTTGEKSAENATVAVNRWTTHPTRLSIGQDIESKCVG